MVNVEDEEDVALEAFEGITHVGMSQGPSSSGSTVQGTVCICKLNLS